MVRLSSFGVHQRGGAVSIVNGREVAAAMQTIEAELRKPANAELRAASKDIATRHLLPALRASGAAADVPQAERFAETATAKSDRMVTVNIGAKRPKLSGLRKSTSRSQVAGMAWGTEYGPYPGAAVDNYGVPRRSAGYWVTRAVQAVLPAASREYSIALEGIFRKYGRH